MNRAELVRALKAEGYSGPLELSAIKTFLAEYGITLQYRGVDVGEKEIESALTAKKSVVIGHVADGSEAVRSLELKAVGADEDEADEEDEDTEKRAKTPIHKAVETGFAGGFSPKALQRRAEVKRYKIRSEQGRTKTKNAEPDQVMAFGAWAAAMLAGKGRFVSKDHEDIFDGVVGKANVTYDNLLGGATVPTDFLPILIDNKEQYGVARQVIGVTPMARETLDIPRRTGSVTIYNPAETASITESQATTDNVTLVARKMAAYSKVSRELLNDSALSFGDFVMGEMAWALANKEDECVFNGDGTSTYFGFHGFRSKLLSLSGTIANIASLVVASGNAYSEIVLGDTLGVLGTLPEYADQRGATWVCSRMFKATVLDKLGLVPIATGAGGNTKDDVAGGVAKTHLGYPVVVSQVMPKAEGNSQVCALFGNFGSASAFGEVTGSMELATSDQAHFQNDVIAFRAIQRVAFDFYETGNVTATAADKVAGPVVGLITASG